MYCWYLGRLTKGLIAHLALMKEYGLYMGSNNVVKKRASTVPGLKAQSTKSQIKQTALSM